MPVVTKFPSSNQAAGSPFNGAWTNPNNAHADDGVYAIAAPGKNQEFASVWNVAFSTFDIPNGATINSVTVEVQWKVSTTSSVATLRSTAFADSAQTTAVSASPGVNDTAEPTADTVRTYTATPTLDQLRDLWVRVQAMRGNTNTAVTCSLDYLKVAVNYTDPPAGTTGTGTVTVSTPGASSAGKERFLASGAVSARQASASANGGERFTAQVAASLKPTQVSGSGTVTAQGFSASASVSSPASSVEAAGMIRFTGTATVTAPVVLASASGTIRFVGSAQAQAAPSTADGEGAQTIHLVGTLDVSASAPRISAGGFLGGGFAGTVSVTAPPSQVSGEAFISTSDAGPWISHGTVHLGHKPNH